MDEIQQKMDDKVKFELRYFKDRIIDYIAFAKLINDSRVNCLLSELEDTLNKVNEVQQTLEISNE